MRFFTYYTSLQQTQLVFNIVNTIIMYSQHLDQQFSIRFTQRCFHRAH